MSRPLEDRLERFIAEAQSHIDCLRETADTIEYMIALFSKANYLSESNKIEERAAGNATKIKLINEKFDDPAPLAIEEEMMKTINKKQVYQILY